MSHSHGRRSEWEVSVLKRRSADIVSKTGVGSELNELGRVFDFPHEPGNMKRRVMLFGATLRVDLRTILDERLDLLRSKVLRRNYERRFPRNVSLVHSAQRNFDSVFIQLRIPIRPEFLKDALKRSRVTAHSDHRLLEMRHNVEATGPPPLAAKPPCAGVGPCWPASYACGFP
jgi:hypothetical protein